MKAILALEDGRIFPCTSFTGAGEAGGEVVFNTSMTGYQEVLTDPSYRGQMVTMTCPLMGNYGVNPEDVESDRIQVAAFIVREYQDFYSNHRATSSLAAYLKSQDVMGIEGLDTRALTRHLREKGAMRAVISTLETDTVKLVEKAKALPSMTGRDLAREVSTEIPYFWRDGRRISLGPSAELNENIWKKNKNHTVAAFDFGIKYNILRSLETAGFEVLVLPATTSASTVKALNPDGIFLSNGPGDPEPVSYAVQTIGELIGFKPIFGICLGNQLLGLAMGAKTFKLPFGHRGGNQAVRNEVTKRVEITSQNHGFAVDISTLDSALVTVTHVNLNDGTLEGFRHNTLPIFTVQYHPEASPGPHDAHYLFNDFSEMVAEQKNKKTKGV
ncbi:glutamine-hydrolyzing carbamoyl-phosphate synthase small subunit [Desulfobotulus sp. H1]|uniref:Carbamoyl phosphate synthase small chain n=1 Tax=Desulfobotulus pelophilus TaxID=2823377 RepID=A0ABT3NBK4_9BACT|nr:glutamine-hydrolyzing carbamoyl-phosphate synthase small subunit [Desulfobotulus pelophilus]MCW7754842.1 glutamine-hydrolyzing carbamoyl-phosphate synthase small subunit [Desulfobotulus pelophilus]